MDTLEKLIENATRSQKKIVLCEGTDMRVVRAAIKATELAMAKIVLVGSRDEILTQFKHNDAEPAKGVEIHDPSNSHLLDEFAETYRELRKHKGITTEQALAEVTKPEVFAALLVKSGHADGMVGGAATATAQIVRTALQVIGKKPGAKLVSSFFLVLFCEPHHNKPGFHIFADCGLVVDPDPEQMAQIAIDSAASFASLSDEEPRIAMLSFSTRGSARHGHVSKVVKATKLAKEARPDLMIDGELQFDAAFVPGVAAAKASDSPLAGNANIFVFPNLDSGNIGYKIAQRIGGATTIGPVLQGLEKPANDLSRGCSVEDIVHMIAVTVAQADDNTEETTT